MFTNRKFTGNQLVVFPDAQGLSSTQMQLIAKEFNFSEAAFVFPTENGYAGKVRIYTPSTEVPFAGHPNIGTAFVLAKNGSFGDLNEPVDIVFEQEAGLVPIKIQKDDSENIWCELAAPQRLSFGPLVSEDLVASVLSLDVSDISTATHPSQVASVGLPFLFVELVSVDSLRRSSINMSQFPDLLGESGASYIHIYCRDIGNFDIRARMFAPMDGVFEDPATGSANCALIALLTHYDPVPDLDRKWSISQGTEIDRPSVLYGRTQKRNGEITGVWIGGNSVLVSEGILNI